MQSDYIANAIETTRRFVLDGIDGGCLLLCLNADPLAPGQCYNAPHGPSVPSGCEPLDVPTFDYYVFKSGLALHSSQVPWVWLFQVDGPPFVEYLYGTAEEAINYANGLERRRKGYLTAPPFAIGEEYLSGRDVMNVDDDEPGLVLRTPSRPFPEWAREGRGPVNEAWPGVPAGTKVWPYVPSGFTTDFAFPR